MFPFIGSIMSGNNNHDGGGKAISTTLSVWDDDAVNLDDNRGWACDFLKSCFKGNNTTKTLARIAKTLHMHI